MQNDCINIGINFTFEWNKMAFMTIHLRCLAPKIENINLVTVFISSIK